MFAQCAHADQADVALQEIDQLRQFIDPVFSQQLAPAGQAKIAVELAIGLEMIVLVDEILQKLGIGIHGSELADIEPLSCHADPFQFDHELERWIFLDRGIFFTLRDVIERVVDFLNRDHLEAAEIESSQCLGFGYDLVFTPCDKAIYFAHDRNLWQDRAARDMGEIERFCRNCMMRGKIAAAIRLVSFHPADKIAAIVNLSMHGQEIAIDKLEIIDRVQIDHEIDGLVGQPLDVAI